MFALLATMSSDSRSAESAKFAQLPGGTALRGICGLFASRGLLLQSAVLQISLLLCGILSGLTMRYRSKSSHQQPSDRRQNSTPKP